MSELTQHYADIKPSSQHVQFMLDGVIVANSHQALILKEVSPKGEFPPVWYIPVGDIIGTYLDKTNLHTFCPIKGEASYYSMNVNGTVYDNIVWYYSDPLPPVAAIKGYVSFDLSRVSHSIIS
ncbi:DUF427 domain-containing protein [uncultured Shewanella sp.]|uniref:DUF427 domain-containing protein n=1 Tax=uncultured Shewanella sp. TaxID=173975 RepID=UPI00261102D3|nr:DUF427 domain-containing protein [uncultured Shewanella sp.]